MKKLSYLFFVFLLVLYAPQKEPYFLKLNEKMLNATYSFYVLDETLKEDDFCVVNNAGLGNIVRCDIASSKKVKSKLNHIMGESVAFLASYNDVMDYVELFEVNIIKTEWIDGVIFNVYGYSKQFSNAVYIENDIVNIQICYNQGTLTLGSPVILGDY